MRRPAVDIVLQTGRHWVLVMGAQTLLARRATWWWYEFKIYEHQPLMTSERLGGFETWSNLT